MVPRSTPYATDRVFEQAAELFGLMSSPIRLRLVSALCGRELNVGQLIEHVGASQPNVSQHLAALHRAGVLARRRDGSQVYYRIGNAGVSAICRSVCVDLAIAGAPA